GPGRAGASTRARWRPAPRPPGRSPAAGVPASPSAAPGRRTRTARTPARSRRRCARRPRRDGGTGPPRRQPPDRYPRPMADDLFASAAEDRLRRQAPLAARLRPTSLDEVVGQQHLLGPDRPLRTLIEADRL